MGIKKKLGLGVASAALGLSLVGGGTWAYFTDTETTTDNFAAGTLNLELENIDGTNLASDLFTTTLQNFKPGDSITRTFKVANRGSLSIKDVVVKANYSGFLDGQDNVNLDTIDSAQGDSQDYEFASQINVQVFAGATADVSNLKYNGSLQNYYALSQESGDVTDVSSTPDNNSLPALPTVDSDAVTIVLTFVDNGDQNKFQGDKMNVGFEFIARQFGGTNFQDGNDVNTINGSQTE